VDELNEILEEDECPHDANTELALVFGTDDASVVIDQIRDNCEVKNNPANNNPLSLQLIAEDEDNANNVWLKAFFDGGTSWNEGRQTINVDGETVYVLEDYPGSAIEMTYEEIALHHVISLPDEISNFDDCQVRAAMCCWVQDRQANDDNGNCEEPYDLECVDADPADNTDICLVDMARAPGSAHVEGGFAVFPEEDEGDTHCHGFAWSEDEEHPSNLYKGNNLFYVSMYDHLYQRGYVKNVPGAPMCGCVEQVRSAKSNSIVEQN
jgi:hypothetical protein